MIGNIMVFKNRKGLSVIELIVAMAVFLLALGLAISLLILFLRNPALVIRRHNMETNAQAIMEQMVRDFRNYTVDYDYYGGTIPTTPAITTLVLLDEDGNQIIYNFDDVNKDLFYIRDGQTVQLNNEDVDIQYLFWGIFPDSSPWEGDDPPNQQPFMTVYFISETDNPYAPDPLTFKLQTSTASRVYLR